MSADRSRKEHRASTRPRPGDLRLCPFCRGGSIVFNEQYENDGIVTPAWVCDNPLCGYRVLARRGERQPQPAAKGRVASSKQLNARARRTVMKSTARVNRSLRRIDTTKQRVNLHDKDK
jgi:hypothetical protein